MNRQAPPSAAPQGREAPAPGRPPLLDSQKLLQGHRAVEIHGELYRLQATRTGKLILTK
jgi:hemin uptake protein HemP